ncbi:hypothetical protein [Halosegnis sp.]|uniref:hypothetical protein n=1 Tax=Halosegnis sp. TaxID=2864959 RepID=UPI0035D44F08
MNKLAPTGDERWALAPHAHVIVYEAADGGELLTIYDCGAAQAPPRAQVVGHLVRVDAAHVQEYGPTGYVVKLRERAELVRQAGEGPDHYVIRAAGD